MAWLDPRLYAHPKVVGLSDKAFRAYIHGLCYCDGMNTGGVLLAPMLRLIGATPKLTEELIAAGLWNRSCDPLTGELLEAVTVNDWSMHNGARDRRKAQDRERQRRWRERQQEDADV